MESTLSCQLVHHGAAAASSSRAVICVPGSDTTDGNNSDASHIVYASDAVVNVAANQTVRVGQQTESVWQVQETLCTRTVGSSSSNATVSTRTAKRAISAITLVRQRPQTPSNTRTRHIVCGFSDGTITSWKSQTSGWVESVLVPADHPENNGRAITDIASVGDTTTAHVDVTTCSSSGATWYRFGSDGILQKKVLVHTASNVVKYNNIKSGATLLLVGTASPRHNKIHVFLDSENEPQYCGSLAGHEDWLTCFDWIGLDSIDHLASGSQDARIRLWNFTSTTAPGLESETAVKPSLNDTGMTDDSEDDEDSNDEEEIEEGESRLNFFSNGYQSSVTLEALLIGHEERVTSVAWHPDPKPIYGQNLVLMSSSMDRSILIWCEMAGVWSPISRVGSAGGILGGSVGSSLLGFLNVILEPAHGKWMMGHGYGGALHFFACDKTLLQEANNEMNVEERAALAPWRAQPCITGHFDQVTDLCWEAEEGLYLLTVGNDQTCRAWAPVPVAASDEKKDSKDQVWVEIARPQVHGYDLSAVTSLSTPDHRHLLVSAADEKELRVFDATESFITLLQRTRGEEINRDVASRVERAYIPSLGLSNKATASEGAEQDTSGSLESSTQLPLERDLGAMSLWPETAKLFGHNTELIRLTSTSSCQSTSRFSQQELLVASTGKARDVDAANIRLWNVSEGRCVQVLEKGHRSTVTALSFSPDGSLLVSSGKDRRLCVWGRTQVAEGATDFSLLAAVDSCHKRIVWDTSFCPSDPTCFATGSRDGTVKVWKVKRLNDGDPPTELNQVFVFSPDSLNSSGKPESVTSLAFAPRSNGSLGLLALGLENGRVEMWNIDLDGKVSPALALSVPPQSCHLGSITRLAWKPKKEDDKSNTMLLASCAADHGCRIFQIEWP